MTSSRRHGPRARKHLLRKHRLLLISFALATLFFALVYAVLNSSRPNVDQEDFPKAAIIDQLSSSNPNSTFWLTANFMFNKTGWRMYYYAGSSMSDNVDFYRALPKYGFKIIILRVHAALNPETETLAFFTSEKWDDLKASTTYLADVMNERLACCYLATEKTKYFGIPPNFVKVMNGNFQDAIIIMMGCDSLTNTEMAEAFIEKGAKAYLGWTGPVSADHTDAVTEQLLKHLIVEKKPIRMAVTETLEEVGNDPTYGSAISYYPIGAGEYKP